MGKLLTIIIPAYNVSDYIDQCLQSLVDNPDNLEYLDIIAVNDGSKDDTLEKMQRYEALYPSSIRVIDKENGGHGSGINRGILEAKGKYLKVLDSDDWVDTNGLTKLIAFIRDLTEDPDVIINPFDYVYMPDGRTERSDFPLLNNGETYSFQELNKNEYLIALHSLTIKTDIYKNHNIPPIDEHISYDDVEYVLYPVPYIHSIVYLDSVIYKYRYGTQGQSVSPANYIKRRNNHEQVIYQLLAYYNERKDLLSDDQVIYYNNRLKWMICLNVNILLSMEDTAQSKKEFREFVNSCEGFDLNIVPNRKLLFLMKHNYRWYSLVSWYYRKLKKK